MHVTLETPTSQLSEADRHSLAETLAMHLVAVENSPSALAKRTNFDFTWCSNISNHRGMNLGGPMGLEEHIEKMLEELPDLAKRSEGQPWSMTLAGALPLLLSLSAEDEAGTEDLRTEPTLVSHRDVVPENILWGPKASWLIDWEGAAWTNPMVELISAAIDWSGYIEGRTDQRIFAAVLEGYLAITPFDAAQALRAVSVSSGSWLRWLAYNITRATGDASSDDDRAVGLGQIGSSLRALAQVRAHQPLWRKWIVDAT